MRILIETIPHDQQRYPTCGDWQILGPPFCKEGDFGLYITVSELGDWRYNACIAIHEAVEVLMCKYKGISQESVDIFDKNFELNRPVGNEDEPGDDPSAPYHAQHTLATALEMILARELGVNWQEYNKAVMAL